MDDLTFESEIGVVAMAKESDFNEKKYKQNYQALLSGYRIRHVARVDIGDYEGAIKRLGHDCHMVDLGGFLYGRSEGRKELEALIAAREKQNRGVRPNLLGFGIPPAEQIRIPEIRINGE